MLGADCPRREEDGAGDDSCPVACDQAFHPYTTLSLRSVMRESITLYFMLAFGFGRKVGAYNDSDDSNTLRGYSYSHTSMPAYSTPSMRSPQSLGNPSLSSFKIPLRHRSWPSESSVVLVG